MNVMPVQVAAVTPAEPSLRDIPPEELRLQGEMAVGDVSVTQLLTEPQVRWHLQCLCLEAASKLPPIPSIHTHPFFAQQCLALPSAAPIKHKQIACRIG